MPKGIRGFQKGHKINSGRKQTEEHIRKISKARMGQKNSLGRECLEETKRKLSIANKGQKRSEEVKRKMRENHLGTKGYKHSEKTKQKISKATKGKKRSEETKKRISEGHKGQIAWNKGFLGEKSHSWMGGKSFELYGIEFSEKLKKIIRKRDKYVCQICGKEEGKRKFPIHHIDYNKENNSMRNLITLCNNCHCKTNGKRESWKLFFENEIRKIYELKKAI